MAKTRKYSESYLKMGFTFVLDDGKEKPLCVLCYTVLSKEAIKPSNLKCLLQQKHPEYVEKDLNFFEWGKLSLKRKKVDASGYFQEQNTANLTASFEVALQIAKQKNS